jgi:hypothetical protein
MVGDKKASNIEGLSFDECRKNEQEKLESIVLGERPTFGSNWIIPEEFTSPLVGLLEELPHSKDRYKEMGEKLNGKNLDQALHFVESGEIIIFSPANETGKICQHTPGKLVDSKNMVSITVGIDWRDNDKGRVKEEKRRRRMEWGETPLNEKLVQFSQEVPNSNNLRYCLIFEPKDTTVASWCPLPYGNFGGTKEWYPLCRDKIGFKEAANQILFSIIDSLNAEVDDNCKVIGKDNVARASKVISNTSKRFGSKINPSYKPNLILHRAAPDESEIQKNKPMVIAWTLCSLLRLLGIIKIRNAKYEKLSGGASNKNISIEFILDKWPDHIEKEMNHIINKITGASRRYMLCKPLSHRVNKPGGYLFEPLQKTFLRPPASKYTGPSQCAIDALNILQKTKWCINESVLEQAEKYLGPNMLEKETGLEELRWQDDKAMNWARELCDREDGSYFWHPWCFDWRGRMYSVSTVISPIGNDLSRGLIQFSEYFPVDEKALNWLKVYLVELFNGVDFGKGQANKKASFADRIKWLDKNEDDIIDIAKHPNKEYVDPKKGPTGKPVWWDISGNGSGLGAGATTFRRLAAALDYSHVIKHRESRMPVQQDASSNWLQHTAMMAQDRKLAKAANLTAKVNTDEPEDVYTKVAEQLDIIWRNKQKSGENHKYIDIITDPQVNSLLCRRSVVKTPLLAVAYGGYPDAKDFLKETGKEEWNQETRKYENVSGLMKKLQEVVVNNKRFGKEKWDEINELDLARTILNDCMAALGQVAPHYDAIQKEIKSIVKDKLGDNSPKDSIDPKYAIKWETPIIKFKVKNHKGIMEEAKIAAANQFSPPHYWSQKITMCFTDDNLYRGKDGEKGGPPNFVHSLDAAHLQLSILNMHEEEPNIPLSIIHDSYGCHAANIEMLRKSVISSFKQIHLPKGSPIHQPMMRMRAEMAGATLSAAPLQMEIMAQKEFEDIINIDEAIYMIG